VLGWLRKGIEMKRFAWILFLLGLLLSVVAALSQWADCSWLAVLLASLSGATFSVLSSLVVNRMTFVHQQLAEVLERVKRTNPLSPQLGHEIKIRKELLTDMGVKEDAPVIVELNHVIGACEREAPHGQGADPLYRMLKTAVFRASVQSIFCPHFGH
jgi:hypothetical protein